MAATLPTDGAVNPSAVGGTYLRRIHSQGAWTETYEGYFSRLDLYAGIGWEASSGLNGGVLRVTVQAHNGASWVDVPEATKLVSTFLDRAEAFYYDSVIRVDGTNAAAFIIMQQPFDRYRVTIAPAGVDVANLGAENCVYRLNGVAMFEHDPEAPTLPELSTLEGIVDLSPESNEGDRRNKIIVVGARKAAVTDSEKFGDDQAADSNNLRHEHHVEVYADPLSIYDPTAPNFQGGERTTVVIDEKVTDGEYAKWLASHMLYTFRSPKQSANVRHTVLPMLEVADAIKIGEARTDSYPHLVWVEGFTETWGADTAFVEMDLTSYPELASYTPREDVDLELFNNRPITALDIGYRNLFGETLNRASLSSVGSASITRVATQIPASSPVAVTLQAHAILETVYLEKRLGSTVVQTVVNHPYRQWWRVRRWNSSYQPTLEFNIQEGDGTAGIYDAAAHSFPSGGGYTWWVVYDVLGNRTGTNPYYDPYTSEVGNLCRFTMRGLVSGLYRISLWAADDNGEYSTPVAWLTDPSGDRLDPEAHWTYYGAGAIEASWDGVDNIGAYNRYQSRDYAQQHEGAFGEDALAVGAGYYTWNDSKTLLTTQIGDRREQNYEYDAAGNIIGQYFSIGKYGKVYLKVEVLSDATLRASQDNRPLEVNTKVRSESNPSGLASNEQPFHVYLHLPEPTQAYIQALEWNPNRLGTNNPGPWFEGTTANGWERINLAQHNNANIRLDKPVKFVFQPVRRKGFLFRNTDNRSSDDRLWTGQVTRTAHLKATLFDQFYTFMGKEWEEGARGVEEKRLTSRMYHNDNHTMVFSDGVWRTGEQLKVYEWVFTPDQFRKDFGSGIEETLRYGDYEMLETIPGHDVKRGGGTDRRDRSYMTLAYINYLFYLSAYVTDRSGRKQHMIDPTFIDKSKIVTSTWRAAQATNSGGANYRPEWALSYESLGAENYLPRSIFVRQWIEPTWTTNHPNSPVLKFDITSPYQRKFIQPLITDFDPLTGTLYDTTASPPEVNRNYWLWAYNTPGARVNSEVRNRGSGTGATYGYRLLLEGQPPVQSMAAARTFNALQSLGSYDLMSRGAYNNLYRPSPGFDFHPYWTKFMPDYNHRYPHTYEDLSILSAPTTQIRHRFRDVLAQDTWFGWSHSLQQIIDSNYDWDRFGGFRVEEVALTILDNPLRSPTAVFDYERQDTLDRFDQFRGVISRAPFASRGEADAAYWDKDGDRIAPAQPIRPTGEHLINLARYDDYIVGPIHRQRKDIIIHSTERVTDFYSIRFRHQYVWQNDKYFPIWHRGSTAYHRFREEYTRPRIIEQAVANTNRREDLVFDAGAWTGHKDDRTTAEWDTNPYLRWAEWGAETHNGRNTVRAGAVTGESVPCGGYDNVAVTSSFSASGQSMGTRRFQGDSGSWQRFNFFDGPYGEHTPRHQRLAVGPQVPETCYLVMNLTIPERLAR